MTSRTRQLRITGGRITALLIHKTASISSSFCSLSNRSSRIPSLTEPELQLLAMSTQSPQKELKELTKEEVAKVISLHLARPV